MTASMVADKAIKHVVLLMLENHSFDQMLGSLQSIYPELDGVDIHSKTPRYNFDLAGNRIFQIETTEQHTTSDPKHESKFVLEQISDGNSGFVRVFQNNVKGYTALDSQYIMGYYPRGYLPALHGLGENFTICDHWFSSLPGPTWPNRFFALSGTSQGRVLMPEGFYHPRLSEMFVQDQTTLFDRLNEAEKSWRIYYYDFPCSLLLDHQRQPENLSRYKFIDDFFKVDSRNEKEFPDFVFIEPKYFGTDQNDDHPPHNIFKAQKLIADVYNAIRSNPELWITTLLVIVYDEHGGFYDHMEPPATIPPDDHRKEWTFDRLGIRVPAILVSPWVGARVEKTIFDHTSLLKYLTEKWGLSSLGRRTATANSIGIALNQNNPREDTVPFIRVPYSKLIPKRPDLEKEDDNSHQEAIHAFGQYLSEMQDAATAALIAHLSKDATRWMKFKAYMGKQMIRMGTSLTKGYEKRREDRVKTIAEVAFGKIRPPKS